MNKESRKSLKDISEKLEELKDCLEDILSEEEEYRDNMPENLQGTEKYENAESAVDALCEVIISLEEATSNIETAME